MRVNLERALLLQQQPTQPNNKLVVSILSPGQGLRTRICFLFFSNATRDTPAQIDQTSLSIMARGEADVPEPDLCLFEEVPAGEVRRRIEIITTSLLAGLGVWKFDKLKPVSCAPHARSHDSR